MINTLNYSVYECVNEPIINDINYDVEVSFKKIEEMKHLLYLITHNHYTHKEVEYIIKNRLLEYDE